MAQPPFTRMLKAEDFQDVPKDVAPAFEKLIRSLNPALSQTADALDSKLTIADNIDATFKTVTAVVPALTGYTTATFSNSWAQYTDTSFETAGYKGADEGGEVWLRGMIYRSSAPSAGQVAISGLPAPTKNLIFGVMTNTGIGDVRINTSGQLTWESGGYGWVSLDNIRYRAASPGNTAAFSGQGWPLTVAPDTYGRVQACFVARAESLDDERSHSVVTTPDWSLGAKNNVVIRRIGGLTPGKYRLTFLFFGG